MNTDGRGKENSRGGRDPQSARQTVRRLIDSLRSGRPTSDSAARSAAAASDHLYRELSRWVGPDGCDALFTRALAQASTEHPALGRIQLHPRSDPYVDGVAETIMAYGDATTAEALESLLVRLDELLGRLIGEDMAMKLIERSLTTSGRGATSEGKREEA
jgi:hypothetical protein